MTSGFTFGAAAAQKTPNLSFGSGTTGLSFGTPNQTPQNTGMTFGTPASTGLFGTPNTQATALPFGPAVTSASTGFSFGAAAATSTPQTGLFGTPGASVPQTGLFGTPGASVPQTGLTFGTPAASTPQTGLTFGTPIATAATQSGLPTFGQTGLNFGTPAASAPSGLTFGTPLATAVPVTTSQPTMGFTTPTINFGTATAAATTTSTATGFGLGTFGGSLGSTTSAPTGFQGLPSLTTSKPGGLFATPTATTSAAPLSLNFSAPTTSLPSSFPMAAPGTSSNMFGIGGKTFLTTTAGTTLAAPTTISTGLGGVDPSQSTTGPTGTTPGRTDKKTVKENQIPNEIVQTIENFKTFVKGQKSFSSEISRGSSKPLYKVQENTEQLKQLLASISSGIQKNFIIAMKLKAETAKSLHNAEMAQHTQGTPPGLQYDNTAPLLYFQELVARFEHDFQILSQEIENTEKHIRSIMQPLPVTSEELSLVMRRLHDSFVALAGRLQSVHNTVEALKEQYLNTRKSLVKDSTDVFDDGRKKSNLLCSKYSLTKISAGPTPFSVLGAQDAFGLLSSQSPGSKSPLTSGNPLGWSSSGQSQQQQLQPQQNQLFSSNLNSSLFSGSGSTFNTLTSPQPVENQGFQLQKPPLGNKRGKR